ncbi:MAG: hypothetical protein FWG64_00705 [Firmicutes bacterium]|nr:hypothetical protein [Bacillota bacterium]
MEILIFFAQVILPLLGAAVSLALAVIFRKGVNWVTLIYANPQEKQRLQEEYDFVRINQHFLGNLCLSFATWLTIIALSSVFHASPYYWLVYVILCLVWLACFLRYIYVMLTKRHCEQFRRAATNEQII